MTYETKPIMKMKLNSAAVLSYLKWNIRSLSMSREYINNFVFSQDFTNKENRVNSEFPINYKNVLIYFSFILVLPCLHHDWILLSNTII